MIDAQDAKYDPTSAVDPQKEGKLAVWDGAIGRFPRALKALALVSTLGAGRRDLPPGDMSYLQMDPGDFRNALARHLLNEAINGPHSEQDWELLEASQQAWNAMARLEIMLHNGYMVRGPDRVVEDEDNSLYTGWD